MQLIVQRHTRVDVSTSICYGQTDVGLASSFDDELETIKTNLNGYSFNKIYSSPLKRCRILAENLNVSTHIEFDDRLKELNFGDWEMKSWNAIFDTRYGKEWMNNYTEMPCPKGESYIDL